MIRNNTKSRCAAGILCLLLLFVLLFTLMTWLLFPLHLLPEEAEVLQCLQQTPAHVLLVCVLFYAVVCWGGSIKKRDAGRLDRLVRRAGAVVGIELDCLTTVAERRTLSRLLTILDNDHHLLHSTLNGQRSIFSGRLLSLSCSSDRLRKSFVPRAIQVYTFTFTFSAF